MKLLSISEYIFYPPFFVILLLAAVWLILKAYKRLLIYLGERINISSIEIEKLGKEMLLNKFNAENKKHSEKDITEKINFIVNSKEFKELKNLKELKRFISMKAS